MLLAAIALGDKIERYGAYFGYAAVIGLGVLSMLYFAQAREVKRLREWAGRAPDREVDLAARAPGRVVAQPIPRAAVSLPPAGPQTPAAQQADAARKAAAATVLEKFQPPGTAPAPAAGPPGSLARPAAVGPPGTVPGVPAAAAPGTPGAPTQAPGSVPGQLGTPGTPGAPVRPAGAAPATAAPPAPGPGVAPSAATAGAVAAARQAAIASRSPSQANGSAGDHAPPPFVTPPPELPSRRREVSSRGPSRMGLYIGGAFTALVIVVVLVLVLTSGGGSPAKQANRVAGSPPPPPAAASKTHSSAPAVDRKATKVAVLNGTTQNGLAASVGSKIEQKGFTILSKATNADQKIATTTVSYAAGQEPAAKLVAKIVDVPASAVQPIDANTATAVTAQADVAVIIGNDVASTG
jgi:hypothetical protein